MKGGRQSGMDWQYRGEGNCSLVVADSVKRKVYRLIKRHYTKKFGLFMETGNSEGKVQAIHSDLQQIISYTRWVMQPLLSPSYVVIPKLITVDEQFVASVVKQVSSQRPARRLKKTGDRVDEESLSALVLPDFCFVSDSKSVRNDSCPPVTISIEIKPKKAFISSDYSDEISESSGVCKFCMHQHLKCQSGQWPETSNYCPLDLFSGNQERMKHALQSLIKTPQNNFKLWRDGENVYSSERREDLEDILHEWFNNPSVKKNRAVNLFLDMVIEILLMSVSPDDHQPHSDLTRSPTLQRCQSSSFMYTKHGHSACQWLPEGCVLERVYAAQLLDDMDVMGVYPMYLHLMTHLNNQPSLWSQWGFDGHFPHNWLLDSAAFHALDPTSLDWKVQTVKRFLVSKTLQDCSIMVAVRPLTNREVEQTGGSRGGNNVLQFGGRWHKVSVALVDLDPKPLDKIPTYFRQATDIRASFQDPSPSTPSTTSPADREPSISVADSMSCVSLTADLKARNKGQSVGEGMSCVSVTSDLKARKKGQSDLL
ncbi:inositol-pentakisphosphate 2-kinase-like [Babylonia areolata]|uniref:inositol-pentakisphosphate 2-kinase-like n=1 Tax=Babylonia areolata TaxID=304850 RepID=UPI003FD4BC6E